MLRLQVIALLAALAPPALGQRQATRLVEPPPGVLAAVDSAGYEAHLRFLSDDLLEGRSPGARGGDLTARYIATQFAAAGLKAVGNSGYLQRVQLLGATTEASLVVGAGRRTIVLEAGTDFVAWPAGPDSAVILDADLVFGGYGIEAPEWNWRDLEPGAVSGKVVIVRPGEPGGAEDSTLFRGRAATRHSRWLSKLHHAARAGAAGILFIHSPAAGLGPWAAIRAQWQRETFQPERTSLRGLRFAAWISAEAARRLVEATGRDYDLLMRRADMVGFSAIDLDARVAVDMRSRFRSVATHNVVGMLEGANAPGTDGAVLLVGHYDHLGIGPSVNGDSVYNGAVDNASGIAGLLTLARAMAAAPGPPRHSIVFAATAAGEQGFEGAAALASALSLGPPGADRIAAVLGLHELNLWAPTRDVAVIGGELSTLGGVLGEATRAEHLEVVADPWPELGSLYESDVLPFAVAGVPVALLGPGTRSPEGHPPVVELVARYRSDRRHQPSDQVLETMILAGSLRQLRVLARAAWHLASDPKVPAWLPGAEFGKAVPSGGQIR